MSKLPESVKQAWNDREGAIVLTTVNEKGQPNAIYATCVALFEDKWIVVADNYFDKTRRNIHLGGNGSILFITKVGKSYQAKGKLAYHKDGPVYDDMKSWNSEKHPGVAALALVVEEVYSGAERIV